MSNELWQRCVRFHGHECPGLAIGVKVCEAAQKQLGISFSPDEEIVCVTENDACGVDAIQVITGCTMGKGNLIYRPRGKHAFTFFDRQSGRQGRFVLKAFDGPTDRKERQHFILSADIDLLFEYKSPTFEVPEKALLFSTVTCESCHERAAEHEVRVQNGKLVCLDCFKAYDRGW